MDRRKNNGGKRMGAGRKSKAKEVELIERLTPYDDLALEYLVKGIKDGNFSCIKLFMEYRYGKPKDQLKLAIENDKPPHIEFIRRVIIDKDGNSIDPLSNN